MKRKKNRSGSRKETCYLPRWSPRSRTSMVEYSSSKKQSTTDREQFRKCIQAVFLPVFCFTLKCKLASGTANKNGALSEPTNDQPRTPAKCRTLSAECNNTKTGHNSIKIAIFPSNTEMQGKSGHRTAVNLTIMSPRYTKLQV